MRSESVPAEVGMMTFLAELGIVSLVLEEAESCAGAWNGPQQGQLVSGEW